MSSEPEVQPPAPVEQPPAPPIPVRQEPAVTAENSHPNEDEVLDRLLGIDKAESPRPVPAPAPSAPDPDLDRALKALQRDGVPSDVIDGMKTDPSKLKEWGLKAAKRQADVDSYGAKVAESKKTEAKSAETPRNQPKASAKTEDGEADADPLSEFGALFGDDAAKPLRSMADRLRSEFETRTKEIEVRHETQLAYARLAGQYGSDAPSYDEVTEAAAQIGRARQGQFNSVEEIVREAFVQKAGNPRRADPRDLARPNAGKPAPRAVRQVDKDDAALDILLSGGSKADVIRVLSR